MKRLLLILFLSLSTSISAVGTRIIPQAEIERIRKNPSSIYLSFQAHRDSMQKFLGGKFSDLSEEELYVIYCSLASYGMAPYGPTSSVDLAGMLRESHLSCGNYPVLTMKLAEAGKPDIYEHVYVPFVAWRRRVNDGHGMLFLMKTNGTDVYVDPTYGYLVRTDFNKIFGGHSVNANCFRDFGYRNEEAHSKRLVKKLIVNGEIRPSELLYYYHSVDVRNRQLPLREATATPRYQIEIAGPRGYHKSLDEFEEDPIEMDLDTLPDSKLFYF